MLASMISCKIPMVDVDLDQCLFFDLYFNLNCSLVVLFKIIFVILKTPHPYSRSIKLG
jgi:hypothetical protein